MSYLPAFPRAAVRFHSARATPRPVACSVTEGAGPRSSAPLSRADCWESWGAGGVGFGKQGVEVVWPSVWKVDRSRPWQPGSLSGAWPLVQSCHGSIRKGLNWFAGYLLPPWDVAKEQSVFLFNLENWSLLVTGPARSQTHAHSSKPFPFLVPLRGGAPTLQYRGSLRGA